MSGLAGVDASSLPSDTEKMLTPSLVHLIRPMLTWLPRLPIAPDGGLRGTGVTPFTYSNRANSGLLMTVGALNLASADFSTASSTIPRLTRSRRRWRRLSLSELRKNPDSRAWWFSLSVMLLIVSFTLVATTTTTSNEMGNEM